MKLGIYIGGTPNRQIDCRHIIENGNPGIGGTEYEFVMLSIYLGQYNIHSDIDLTIFQTGRYTLPDQIISINGVHPADMLNEAKKHGIDLLIIDSRWPLNLIKNIAAENYEKKFGKYLSTESGLLHPSVILHGQLGKEKYEIMTKCRVGIPNPDGNTETFCICAVEMQLCGCKVVTKWSSGYIDTVPFPNIMVSRTKDLASAIASSLVEDNFDCTSNLWNIRTHFSINTFGNKWMKIIHSVYDDSEFSENITIPAQFKSRKINASIRKFLPFIPPIGLLSDTIYRFVVVLKRNIFH